MMSLRNHAFLLGRLTVRAARAAIYTIVPQQCPQQNSPTYHSYGRSVETGINTRILLCWSVLLGVLLHRSQTNNNYKFT
jgi:hypothetical protein